jgi:hypothetical protein
VQIGCHIPPSGFVIEETQENCMKKLSLVLVAALVFAAAAGCKKKSNGGDCAGAVHHSMDLSKADMEKMGTDAKMMQKMVDIGIQHCKDDKWSADALKCMTSAMTMSDAQGCYTKLTPEQQSKMNKAAMELMTPAGGTGGGAATGGGADTGSAAAGSAAAAGGDTAAGSGSAGSAAPSP